MRHTARYIDDVVERAEENYTEYLSQETSQRLQQGYDEGIEWIGEVFPVICHIFHHAETLAHILLDLEMHENRANEANAEHTDVDGERDAKALA